MFINTIHANEGSISALESHDIVILKHRFLPESFRDKLFLGPESSARTGEAMTNKRGDVLIENEKRIVVVIVMLMKEASLQCKLDPETSRRFMTG